MSLRLRFRIHCLNRKLNHAAHIIGPTLVALVLAGATNVAHAQGTMDFSGAQTLMSTFKTFAMYAGAVICLGGLIFAGARMQSGRFQVTLNRQRTHRELIVTEEVRFALEHARGCALAALRDLNDFASRQRKCPL